MASTIVCTQVMSVGAAAASTAGLFTTQHRTTTVGKVMYQTVGRSGLRVSSIGLATRTWGRGTSAEQATQLLHRFLDSGGSFLALDAPAQAMFQDVSRGINASDLVIAATSGVDAKAAYGRRVDTSRRNLMRELDATLQATGLDHLDLWTVGHWDPEVPVEEVASTLNQAITEGKVRYAGVRGYLGWQLALTHAAGGDIIAAETEYNLLSRALETDLFPAAEYLQVGIIAGAPLAHGVLSGQYQHGIPETSRAAAPESAQVHSAIDASGFVVPALRTAAEGLGISMAVAACAWTRQQPGVSAVLVTPRTPEHLDELLTSTDVHIPRTILAALDDVTL